MGHCFLTEVERVSQLLQFLIEQTISPASVLTPQSVALTP